MKPEELKTVRKRYILLYPRQGRAFIKQRSRYSPEPWTSSIGHLLMCATEVKAILSDLTKREKRGLRIVEVPL